MKPKIFALALLLLLPLEIPVSSPSTTPQVSGARVDNLIIRLYPTYDALIQAFEANQIDLLDSTLNTTLIDRYSTSPWNTSITLDAVSELAMFEIDLNNNETLPTYRTWPSPTSYQSFRHALAHLTDKSRYVNEILEGYGVVLSTPVMPWMTEWYNSQADAHQYNKTEAAVQLDSGGFVDGDGDGIRDYPSDHLKAGKDLDPLKFFAVSEDPVRLKVAQRLTTEMLTLGIPVNLTITDWSNVFTSVIVQSDFHLNIGKQDMYHSDVTADTAATYFGGLYQSDTIRSCGSNYVRFNNTQFDSCIRELRQAPDEGTAVLAAKEAQRILAEQVGIIPLFARVGYKAHKNLWVNVVNEDGNGVDSWWTFLMTHQQNQPAGGTLGYGIVGDPNGLNPLLTFSSPQQSITDLIYESLLRVRNLNPPVSRIASGWTVDTWLNPDTGSTATKLVYDLNSNIYFHDGVQLTSADVKFSIDYIKTHKMGNSYARVANVHHVDAPDASTVVIYESTMNTRALDWIGSIPIVPKHKWQSIADPFVSTPEPTLTGSGPFRFVEYVPNDRVFLTANRNYLLHDVAVTNTTPTPTVVYQGGIVEISVTIQNQGDFTETFDVNVYANSTLVSTESISNLASGNTVTLTINWDTNDFQRGNYTINTRVTAVLGELDTSDNILIDSTVQVTITGDVNGDGIVNNLDLAELRQAYGSTSAKPNWNPLCDFNGDSKVDILDLLSMSKNYGKDWL